MKMIREYLSDGMTSESLMQCQPGERGGAVAAAAGRPGSLRSYRPRRGVDGPEMPHVL